MKTIGCNILLLIFFSWGCSQTNNASSGSAIDRIQAGKDISVPGYILHVEKRAGSSIEGIRIVSKEPDGQTATITAERGTLSQGPDQSFIKIILYDASVEKGKQKWHVKELTINLSI